MDKIQILNCTKSQNLYYFFIGNILVGSLITELGEKFCVVKALHFERNVPLSVQLNCLAGFQKFIGCDITPENIYKHKTLWMEFFSNITKILSKL